VSTSTTQARTTANGTAGSLTSKMRGLNVSTSSSDRKGTTSSLDRKVTASSLDRKVTASSSDRKATTSSSATTATRKTGGTLHPTTTQSPAPRSRVVSTPRGGTDGYHY
jgi:hypothetical protein